MNQFIAIENIEAVLSREALLPTIVMWNRLEGRPRREDFLRSLRAEVRDPLWMLCKQWQVGEFRGDDAGSPVFAKVHIDTTRITRFRPGAALAQDFDNETPLEATVEQRPVNFFGQEHILSLDIRLAMGRQWSKLLGAGGLGAHGPLFVQHYGIDEPDPASRSDAFITAHAAAWQSMSALAGRAMDGAKLYFYLKAESNHRAHDGLAIPDADKPAIDLMAERFIAWYEGLFYQPLDETNDAWHGSQLEYRFAVSAPVESGEKAMVAEEYYHGRLDWYSLDVDPVEDSLSDAVGDPPPDDPRASFTHAFFPVNLQFEGMPNTRWWTFEDSED